MSNLVHYNQPLTSIFDDFENNINRFLSSYPARGGGFSDSNVGNYWLPNIDVKEEDRSYVITADVPGMEKKDIKISIDQYSNLIIEGERDTEVKKEKKGYICFERHKGSFFRKIALPGAVDAQDIKAKYQQGVLEVNVPKSKESVVKQINVED
jgi:HSP20 family protein